jgi:hypothetical protein
MTLASELGNEAWYATWATVNATFVDRSVAFSVVFLWVSVMYLGQYLKDALRLPRPGQRPGSHIARLETHYAAEFGFPSTHTMGAVSQPTTFFYLIASTYTVASPGVFTALAAFCAFWFFLTPLSRFYFGVHSSLDVGGGFLLGALPTLMYLPMRDTLEAALTGPTGACAIIAAALVLIALYPRPRDRWTNSPGDTAIIVSTGAGILSGFALVSPPPPFLVVALPAGGQLPRAVARLAVNVVLIYSLRLALKPLVRRAAAAVVGRPEDAPDAAITAAVAVAAAPAAAAAAAAALADKAPAAHVCPLGETSTVDAVTIDGDTPHSAGAGVATVESAEKRGDCAGSDTRARRAKQAKHEATEGVRTVTPQTTPESSPVAAGGDDDASTTAASQLTAAAAAPAAPAAAAAAKLMGPEALGRRYFIEMSDKAVCYFLMGFLTVTTIADWLDAWGLIYELPLV